MAYGLKYTGSLIDYFGRTLTVNIYENDYIGTSTTVTLAGVNMTLNGDDENVFKNILSTSVSVGLLSETDFQFIELYTGDKRKYRMDIVRDSVLKWRGWLVPDLYTETYAHSENYITTITARDGLVELETTDFDLTGVKSHDEIIQLGITLVTSDTNDILYVGVNTFEENHVTTESPLSQTFVDCKRYEGLTWNEVFLDICKLYGARLYQKNGDFWFVSTFELKNEFNWTSYNGIQTVVSTGTEDTELVVGLNEADKWANVDQQLNILPPWREVKVVRDLGYSGSALENHEFDNWTTNTDPENWLSSVPSLVQRYSASDKIAAQFAVGTPTPTNNISQQLQYVEGNKHGLKINIRFKIIDAGQSGLSQFWIKIQNTDVLNNNAYLTEDGTWSGSESFINFQGIEIKAEQDSQFIEYEIPNTDQVPLDGSLTAYIYRAEFATLIVDSFNIQFTFPVIAPISIDQFGVYPDEAIEDVFPVGNNTFTPEDTDLLTGDLPDYIDVGITDYDGEINEKFIYIGGLYLAANKNNVTTNWRYNDTDYTDKKNLTEIIANQNSRVSLNPYWAITGTLLTQNLESDSTIVDVAVNSKKYLVSNGDFDLERCQFNGTYIEIGSYSSAAALCVIVDSTGLINDNGTHSDSALWVD